MGLLHIRWDRPARTNQADALREEAWNKGKIVWIATWRGRKGRIVSGRAVPNWVHEGGNEVRWKVIEGGEYLESLAINSSQAVRKGE